MYSELKLIFAQEPRVFSSSLGAIPAKVKGYKAPILHICEELLEDKEINQVLFLNTNHLLSVEKKRLIKIRGKITRTRGEGFCVTG